MNKKMLMMAAVLSGGFPFPYTSNFAAGSMGALRGDGWTVTGGQAVNAPVEGTELLSNGNMEAGNPPTGWAAGNSAVLTGQADERTGGAGAQCIQVARNGVAFPTATQTIAGNTGWHWIKFRGYHKRGTASNSIFTQNAGFTGVIDYFSETSWTQKTIASIKVGGGGNFIASFGAYVPTTDGQTARWDDVSAVPLTKLTAGLICPASLPVVKATVNVPLGESAGVYVCGDGTDPSNYIGLIVHRYQDNTVQRGHIYLYKVIAGVATRVYGATVAYASDGAHVVEIRRTAATTFQVWYDNTQSGTDQTISDAQLQSLRYAGLIATGGGVAVDAFFCGAV